MFCPKLHNLTFLCFNMLEINFSLHRMGPNFQLLHFESVRILFCLNPKKSAFLIKFSVSQKVMLKACQRPSTKINNLQRKVCKIKKTKYIELKKKKEPTDRKRYSMCSCETGYWEQMNFWTIPTCIMVIFFLLFPIWFWN